MLKNNIGRELQKQDKSQRWLSDATGISKGMISQIVSGRSVPTPEELNLICGVMGCRRELLFDAEMLQLISGESARKKPPRQTVKVRITIPICSMVDRYAKELDLSRDEAARQLIVKGATRRD